MEHVERVTIALMKTTTRLRRAHLAVAAALCVSTLGLVVATGASAPMVHAQTGPGAGGEYHPVPPTRIFDSRLGGIGRRAITPQGQSFEVNLNQGGIPADSGNVLAVVVNVTVASPTVPGYLSIRPSGSAGGTSSLVNFDPGRDVPNLAIVGVGAGGNATIDLVGATSSGQADVLVDVFGWISKSAGPAGSRLIPVTPTRLLDTRSAPAAIGRAGGVALGPGEQLSVQIRGNQVVPVDNVTGVMVNVTAINEGAQGTFVSATPDPVPAGSAPATSVTNLNPGQVKANTAIVPVGADGRITLYNGPSTRTHLIVDVLGYLQSGHGATSSAGRVIPLDAPFRVFDTRLDAFGKAPLGFASVENWSFSAFANSVTLGGVPLGGQSGVIGNLTATGLQRVYPTVPVGSFLTVFPGDVGMPISSNVNLKEGESVPNMSLLKYGAAGGDPSVIKVYNHDGSTHYILDVYAVVLS